MADVIVYGINPIVEALKSGRVISLRVAGDRLNARLADLVRQAEQDGVPVKRVAAADLDRASRGGVHQGIVADLRDPERIDLSDLVGPWLDARERGETDVAAPLLVVLDGIEDPHNVGAILRSVDAAGADGVVRQSRRAAALEGAAAKASAGAVSHVKIAEVVNIARALEDLKELGVWTVGLAGDTSKLLTDIDLTLPTAIVLGAEGEGLRRLVRERCDWLASIPMRGHVQSLNVSVAAGVALFEAVRQRSSAVTRPNR